MAKGTTRPPRAKDVAAALGVLGVQASYLRSPKTGEWLVKAGPWYVLPLVGGKFRVAKPGSEVREVNGTELLSVVTSD